MNDFAKGQRLSYPKVDILRNTNIVILNGPGNIRPTNPHGQNTSDLERRINLPQDVITFIKSSNAVRKYQALFQQRFRNPVFIEVGSDLVLFCKCPHDLDEAQAELVGDLSVEIEKLQGAAAVPPDTDRLKETLMKAKTVLNRDELRVDFSFIPGQGATTVAKVRLVGYPEYVKNLRDVLQDYLLNQVFTKEVLNLQHPEMVDCFGKILELISIKQTQVTLKQSLLPKPCVAISGPRCHVQEAHKALRSGLASLALEKLVLDGPGAVRYFQAEGKTSKELVESSCKVLIQERQVSAPRQFIFSTPSLRHTTTTSQQSSFLFVGLQRKNVDAALTKIKNLYQDHSATKTFTNQDLADLTEEDIKKLMNLVETQDLYVQEDPLGQGGLMVSGLKAGINQVNQVLQTLILRKELRANEEESLYPRIAWCILGQNGNWERLPKTGNYNLENHNTTKGIVDAHGVSWSVNLLKMEARRDSTGQTAKLKRLKNLPDFIFPLEWDNMAHSEVMKRVQLHPCTPEYRRVKQGFKQTANYTIIKIERVQNIHLRRAYEAQKKKIFEKNKQEGAANEKFLYHGTTEDNCESIMKTGFNRRFCGQNATVYGEGTYFAVDASYSSHPTYSRPATDGSQLMFVARVLTGVYTLGQRGMKVPPALDDQDPHIRYDSVVDKMDRPNMFVVFHDDQACLDYLITFKQ